MSQAIEGLPDKQTSARVTISDMAKALGLTKSTVSRALNGYPDIAESTRLRVAKMARRLNYQPLSYAQAVKTGRTRSLGLVLQLSDHDAQRPFLAEFLAGLSAGASREGYTMTVASADTHDTLIETFRTLTRDGKADGFILPRAMVNDPRARILSERGVPFVLYGRQQDPTGCAWFDVRGEDAMRDAVAHLATLGHRRIGFINGRTIYSYAALRLSGFKSGMAACDLPVAPELIVENAVTRDDGAAAAAQLLDHPDPPTAIVCAVDYAALGAYRAAAERGLTIGTDLSIVAYDGTQDGAQAQPPLTTFSVDNRAAGERLATLLIRRVRGEALETLRETISADFVCRMSTGPVKTQAHPIHRRLS
ncbi:substrate-binding domain-containing protein [uncultured Tateyamaria sp.]|uniref:LacI family DNA-binding transcriptional regulator n=1 Tax=uncultured Tateyamaria sp. TaxID=455651 RepID=UPI00261BA07E|nr:substrate-binding domain-containing protein [uncultured Tateyamaria sp.]